jgi:hypothetical protein
MAAKLRAELNIVRALGKWECDVSYFGLSRLPRGEGLHTCAVVKALRSLPRSVKCQHRNMHVPPGTVTSYQLPDHIKLAAEGIQLSLL